MFGQAGVFDGRLWLLTRWVNETLRLSAIGVWIIITISYVLGRGLELPPTGWLLAIGLFAGFSAAIELGDEYDEGSTFQTAVDLRIQYAISLWEQGDRESAVRQLRQAIAVLDAKGIDDATPYAIYGWYLFERRQLDSGIRYCRRALEVDPESVLAHVNYSAILIEGERYDEAEPHCQRALELASMEDGRQRVLTSMAHCNYASLLSERGCNDDAEAHCRRALEINETEPIFHAIYGAVLAEQGAFAAAEHRFQRAIDLDPEHALTRLEYAEFHDTYGDDAEAERQFRSAIDLDPDHWLIRESYTSFLEERDRTGPIEAQ